MSDRRPTPEPSPPPFGAPPPSNVLARLGRAPPWVGPTLLWALVIVVFCPALGTQFIFDDFLHDAMLDGVFPGGRARWDLYNFVDDSNRQALLERGLLPWWAHPELQLRFFRPLSSWLIALDDMLFSSPIPMHLHSFLWWVLAILGAQRLYRELLPARVATLATFVFVLAPCHAAPLSWLANRDALLSLTFGIWGILSWSAFRRGGSRWLGGGAFFLFALGFGAGEYAFCIVGFALALELARPAPIRERALGVMVWLVPAATYLVVRSALGYGAHGSGYYTDPFQAPLEFLQAAPYRFVVLFLNAWLFLKDDAALWTAPNWVIVTAAIALAAVLTAALRHALPEDAARRRTILAFAAGAMLAIIPVLAGMPVQRVLGASVLGIAPVAATIMDAAWFRTPLGPRRGMAELTGTVAVLLGFFMFIHAPVRTFLACERNRTGSLALATQAASLAERSGDVAEADIVIVRGMASALFLGYALSHGALPHRYRLLAQCRHLLLVRQDERVFELVGTPEYGVVGFGTGSLYRDASVPLREGEVFDLGDMTITLTDVDGGLVMAASVELAHPPEAAHWFNEREHEYEVAELPPIGFGAPFDYTPGAEPISTGAAD